MPPLRSYFHRTDGLLFAAGLAGFILFLWGLPREHPDATVSLDLSPEGAVETAQTYLTRQGFRPVNYDWEATPRRSLSLLDSLQRALNRAETVRLLNDASTDHLPAYYWHVRAEEQLDEREDRPARSIEVAVTLTGAVWSFEHRGPPPAPPDVSHPALRAAFAATRNEPAPSDTLPDSTLQRDLAFWFGPVPAQPDSSARSRAARRRRSAVPNGPDSLTLGPTEALAMARHHLEDTALRSYSLALDSLSLLEERPYSAARVILTGQDPVTGQPVETRVDVAATGGLVALTTTFNPKTAPPDAREEIRGRREDDANISFSFSDDGLADVLTGITYLVLIVFTLFLFFRRLSDRLVDVKAALQDALWGGVFLAALVALTAGEDILTSADNLWTGLAILGAGVLVAGAGGAFLFFLISSATDSIARTAWPEKLETLSLARHVNFRNLPVGMALLRGMALTGILTGVSVFVLILFPDAAVAFDGDSEFVNDAVLSTAGYSFARSGFGSLLTCLLVLLGAGSILHNRSASRWPFTIGTIVLIALIQSGPIELAPSPYQWLLSGLTGLVLAYSFWEYDFMTSFTGFLMYGTLWGTLPGWLVQGSPAWVDALVIAGLLLATLGIGLVGILSRNTGEEGENYVPAYLEEMAQQERLKGELAIAHQVQESFLPRSMPRVEGLDISAMCLPAQEVGGDYYDFVDLGAGRLAVVVGDVSGKGIQAAFYMTLTKGFLRSLCREVASPAEVLRRLNTLFCESAPRGMFISMIYGIVDVPARTFTFARAGHDPIILKRSPSQEAQLIQPAGIAIGLTSGPIFNQTITEATINLRPGDVLAFYTDGFTEAMNSAREQFGNERLARKVSDAGHRTANEILRNVTENVHHFIEAMGRHDDMTMVVIKLASQRPFNPAEPPTA